MQVTFEEDDQTTFPAEMLVSPERRSFAVRLDEKSEPVMTVDTVVPASPSSGSIALIAGLVADSVIVVVAAADVVVSGTVAAVVTSVVTMVGAAVGIEETATWAIFTV